MLRNMLLSALTRTYPPDGWDPIELTYNGKTKKKWGIKSIDVNDYLSNPVTFISSFFGLPNACLDKEKPSWLNVLKKTAGWQDNKSLGRSIFNGVKAPIVFLINIAFALLTTALNIIKIFTELLPRLAIVGCEIARRRARKNSFLYYLATAGMYFFKGLYFIGRAITSPANNIRASWKAGHELATAIAGEGRMGTVLGAVLGGLLAAISLAITATTYTLAFPFAIKMLPTALGQVVTAAINVLSTPLSFLGTHVIMPVFGHAFNFLAPIFGSFMPGLAAAISPAEAAVGAAVGLTLPALSSLVSYYVINPITRWWNTSAKKQESAPTSDAPKVASDHAAGKKSALIGKSDTLIIDKIKAREKEIRNNFGKRTNIDEDTGSLTITTTPAPFVPKEENDESYSCFSGLPFFKAKNPEQNRGLGQESSQAAKKL